MLYLIRHGSTDANENNPPVLQGRSLDNPLSANGIIQAEKTAKFLSKKSISKIYSSPMKRAVQTAEIINRHLGLTLSLVEDIVECSLGSWEGLTFDQVKEKYPVDYGWFQGDTGHRTYGGIKGGESYILVLKRILPFFSDLNFQENIAVIAHGIVNKAYLASHLKLPLKFAKNLPQDNCAINMFSSDRLTINYVEHL